IVLGITSNPGADDFQFIADANGQRLFEAVIAKCAQWGTADELMFVTGATRPEILRRARELAPGHFFLVPGVGAQGGDLDAVLNAGMTASGGLLINSSRGVLYAGAGQEAIPMARKAAMQLQRAMEGKMRARGVI
ncbi:MAG TPA: orotidine 5'-phosphate decarboxylase, partial [Flavobacteriales bacterium]|nr:orotidine 5'-phosphate decarboxylase [Flavobacteriales bacterium]